MVMIEIRINDDDGDTVAMVTDAEDVAMEMSGWQVLGNSGMIGDWITTTVRDIYSAVGVGKNNTSDKTIE